MASQEFLQKNDLTWHWVSFWAAAILQSNRRRQNSCVTVVKGGAMSMHCPVSGVTVSHQNRRKIDKNVTINIPVWDIVLMRPNQLQEICPHQKHSVQATYKKGTLVILCTWVSLVAISGPKKVLVSGPTLPMAIVMDLSSSRGERYEVYLLRITSPPPPLTGANKLQGPLEGVDPENWDNIEIHSDM